MFRLTRLGPLIQQLLMCRPPRISNRRQASLTVSSMGALKDAHNA